jgi:hypothetical protein
MTALPATRPVGTLSSRTAWRGSRTSRSWRTPGAVSRRLADASSPVMCARVVRVMRAPRPAARAATGCSGVMPERASIGSSTTNTISGARRLVREAVREDLPDRSGAGAEREHAVGEHEDERATGAAGGDPLAGEGHRGGEVGALLAAAGVEGRGDAVAGGPVVDAGPGGAVGQQRPGLPCEADRVEGEARGQAVEQAGDRGERLAVHPRVGAARAVEDDDDVVGLRRGGRLHAQVQAEPAAAAGVAVVVGHDLEAGVERAVAGLRDMSYGPGDDGGVVGLGDEEGGAGVGAGVDPEARGGLASGLHEDAALGGQAGAVRAAAGEVELPAVAAEADRGLQVELDLGGRVGLEREDDELGGGGITGGGRGERTDVDAAGLAPSGLGGDARGSSGGPDAVAGDLQAVDLRLAGQGEAEDGVLLAVAGVVEGDAEPEVGVVAVGADDDGLVAELLNDLEVALRVGLEVDAEAVGAGGGGRPGDAAREREAGQPASEHPGTVAQIAGRRSCEAGATGPVGAAGRAQGSARECARSPLAKLRRG